MLCRALLVAVVLSYVLCVLLLSGVQKEDIDAGTLRKLQRHNVNIDDINDRQVRERCLGKTDSPINLTTLQASSTTERTTTGKTVTEKNAPNEIYTDMADSTPLQKILEYLEYKHKDERRKALESKDNIRKSKLGPNIFTTLPSRSSSQDKPRRIKIEDPSTESVRKIITNNDVVKINKADMNKELEKLMKMWQTNIDRMSDTTKQESTTIKIFKDDVLSKNSKDIEYITKIVAEIMSKRQLNDVNTLLDVKTSTTIPKDNSNSSEIFRGVEQAFATQFNNETFLLSSFLNNCKQNNILVNKVDGKEKSELLENLTKRLNYGVNGPVTNISPNDEYVICKRFEPKEKKILPPHQIDDYTINYILNKIRKERQGNVLDSVSSTFETLLDNQPKSTVFKPLGDQAINANTYKETINLLDNESAKVLQAALENQSKSIFFDRQSGRMKIGNTYKNRFNQQEDENPKTFETGLENQPKIKHFDHESDHSKSTNTFKEKQNNFPGFVEENKNLWAKYAESLRNTQEPTLEDEPTKTAMKSPNFRYKSAKKYSNGLEEEYKRWLFMYHNPSNKQEPKIEMKQNTMFKNGADDHEKSTNIMNSIQYDQYKHGNQYKLPWFYGESSNEQVGHKIKGKQDGALFKPKDNIADTIDPRLNVYKKIWPPYFEAVNNNSSVIPMETHEMSKNYQEPVLLDLDSPQLTQLNGREISPEVIDSNKNNPDFVERYPSKTPYVTEDRSDEQFGPKRGDKIIQGSPDRQNKIDPPHDAEYKGNWAYFRDRQINNQKPNMEEQRDMETEYFTNSKSTQQNYFQYPLRTHKENDKKLSKDKGAIESRYVSREKLPNTKEKKDYTKFPEFPPNVIKDIANSVKEIVLRDLKTTTVIPTTTTLTTTTPSTTTTATSIRTTTPTTTTTPATTTSTTSTTTSTTKFTTTEGTLITTKDPLKIQDASKALEKIIEMFEKISSIKDKMVTLDNVRNTKDVSYDTPTTTSPGPQIIEKLEQEYKPGHPLLYAPIPPQLTAESRVPYNVDALQLKTENRISYDPQPAPFKTENRASHFPEAAQLNIVNRIPYNPLQYKVENHMLYDTQAPHLKVENHVPYETQAGQLKTETRIPYETQAGQLKTENRIPYETQAGQLKTEDRIPYETQTGQLKTENRIPYETLAGQLKTENHIPYDPQVVQLKAQNRLTYNQQAVQLQAENSLPYNSQAQLKVENRLPYNPQPLQFKAENNIQYDPQPVQMKSENRIAYEPQPVQRNIVNRIPYDYSAKSPYYHSKVEYNPYLEREVLQPVLKRKAKKTHAITVQTNSGEIAPLKIAVKKPLLQNIVLTTKPPITEDSDETFNFRKPITSANRVQVNNIKENEATHAREKKPATRYTHRDNYSDIPKSRKIKKEREFNEEYKPRDMQAIDRFHEKLERGDTWPRYEKEKIAQRIQRPLVKKANYDDTHFRNFLQTQQKVNAMLEKILGSSKKTTSSEG